jgi:hypothetical protein
MPPLDRNDNASLFWNDILLQAALADSVKPLNAREQDGPTRTSRVATIVHAAIHNAVNGVQQLNTFYQDPKTGRPAFPAMLKGGTFAEAAAA